MRLPVIGLETPGCETTGVGCMSGAGSVARLISGNIQHTSDLLDVSRPTVYRRIGEYKIDTENLAQYTQS